MEYSIYGICVNEAPHWLQHALDVANMDWISARSMFKARLAVVGLAPGGEDDLGRQVGGRPHP